MKLFRFRSGETDWVAADTVEEAIAAYKAEYGLNDRDMDGVVVVECDAESVSVYPDDWDYDSEDEPPTAAAVMSFMKRPGLVATTAN